VQIIERLPADCTDFIRRQRESYWIRKLRTKYPYGLNDNLLNEQTDVPVWENLTKDVKPRTDNHKKRGIHKPTSTRRGFWNVTVNMLKNHCDDTFASFIKAVVNHSITAPKRVLLLMSDIKFKLKNINDVIHDQLEQRDFQSIERKTNKQKPKIVLKFGHELLNSINFKKFFQFKMGTR